MTVPILIIWIVTSLIFSAFFSGVEIAFISSNKLRVELDRKQRGISSKILPLFFANSQQFISTMLVGNNIALVVYGLRISELLNPFFESIWDHDVFVLICQTLLSTLIVLIIGEFIPKTIFSISPNKTLSALSIPLFIVYLCFYPISKFTSLLSYGVLRLFGVKIDRRNDDKVFNKVDLDYYIQQGLENKSPQQIIDSEVKIFRNALDFSNVKLRDCMVPRTEIVAVDSSATIELIQQKFVETGLSKIMVYEDNIDHIIGYIHSSVIFKRTDKWQTYVTVMPIVPESMSANKLMDSLMREQKSLAVVVDEFGGTSGLVTMEDLVEEIFGEIEDEHDTQDWVAKKVSDSEYIFSGRAEIDYLNDRFELSLPTSEEYVTLAGYILARYETFPKVNETIEIDQYQFKVLKVSSTKIYLVRMKILV